MPSTQEIYLSRTGLSSVIIDILERVLESTDEAALQHHLADIVDPATDVLKVHSTAAVKLDNFPPGTPAYTVFATSTPRERKEGDARQPVFTALLVTLIRLEDVKTDLVVTVNVPHVKMTGKGELDVGNFEEGSVNVEEGKYGSLIEEGVNIRGGLLKTLKVADWGLFLTA